MTTRIHWRCFHCGDTFTKAQHKHAAAHFGLGRNDTAKPVCLIRSAGETGLLDALREAEEELSNWRSENMPILQSMYAMMADHAAALKREEEAGYAKGLKDAWEDMAPAMCWSADHDEPGGCSNTTCFKYKGNPNENEAEQADPQRADSVRSDED